MKYYKGEELEQLALIMEYDQIKYLHLYIYFPKYHHSLHFNPRLGSIALNLDTLAID